MAARAGVIVYGNAVRGASFPVLARVTGMNNQPITQASVASIAYKVTDSQSGQVLSTGSLSVASTVYNQLQQGNGWSESAAVDVSINDGLTGWNFLWVVPGSLTSPPGSLLTAQATLTMVDGSLVVVKADRVKLG